MQQSESRTTVQSGKGSGPPNDARGIKTEILHLILYAILPDFVPCGGCDPVISTFCRLHVLRRSATVRELRRQSAVRRFVRASLALHRFGYIGHAYYVPRIHNCTADWTQTVSMNCLMVGLNKQSALQLTISF